MTRTKTEWREGDEGWEVEWCTHLPCYPDDPTTIDTDNVKFATRDFRDKDEAYAFAREVFPKSLDGVVRITPFVLERLCEDDPFHIRHNCHTEYKSDTDYYEGEDD